MHIKIDFPMYRIIKSLKMKLGDIAYIENETSSVGNYNVIIYGEPEEPEDIEQLKDELIEESKIEKPVRLREDGRE